MPRKYFLDCGDDPIFFVNGCVTDDWLITGVGLAETSRRDYREPDWRAVGDAPDISLWVLSQGSYVRHWRLEYLEI